jgi:hypothetical protein
MSSYMPELRDALVAAAERQAAPDAGPARDRTPTAARSRSRWAVIRIRRNLGTAATVLATAAAIAVVVVALTAVRHGRGQSASPASVPTAASARSAAERLLDHVALPAGAVRIGLHGGIPADLWSPSDYLGTGRRVGVHRIWRLPGGPHEAIAFIEAHRPAGARVGGGSSAGSGQAGGPERIATETVVLPFPEDPSTSLFRELAVNAVALSSGGTVVRVDAEAGWLIPRPATERIPAGVDRIDVTATGQAVRQGKVVRAIRITDPGKVRALVGILNGMIVAQAPGPRCLARTQLRARYLFFAAGHATPVAAAVFDSSCMRIAMTVGGRAQPDLTLGFPGRDIKAEEAQLKALAVFMPASRHTGRASP